MPRSKFVILTIIQAFDKLGLGSLSALDIYVSDAPKFFYSDGYVCL